MFEKEISSYKDEKLMQLIAIGHPNAFDELYRRYHKKMYYFFYRMLWNSEATANDFLQELFMKIIENPQRFNPSYSFKTWIFSIAWNQCKNEFRRNEIRKEPIPMEANHQEPVMPKHIDNENIIETIYDKLKHLDPEHQSVFVMHYREGFQIKEIATILGISPGTVKSRLFYTRKYLAEKLSYLKDEIEL